MAEFKFSLSADPFLGGVDLRIGDNQIVERDDLAIVSVAIPLDGEKELAQSLQDGWKMSLPSPIMATQSGAKFAIRTTPDQLLLVFPHAQPDAERVVAQKLSGTGYTTDQTDVWVVLEISGPQTIAALERICPLDAASIPPNGSARTVMEHMGALILRLGDDRFWLFSASSSAVSFLHAVETSFRNVSNL